MRPHGHGRPGGRSSCSGWRPSLLPLLAACSKDDGRALRQARRRSRRPPPNRSTSPASSLEPIAVTGASRRRPPGPSAGGKAALFGKVVDADGNAGPGRRSSGPPTTAIPSKPEVIEALSARGRHLPLRPGARRPMAGPGLEDARSWPPSRTHVFFLGYTEQRPVRPQGQGGHRHRRDLEHGAQPAVHRLAGGAGRAGAHSSRSTRRAWSTARPVGGAAVTLDIVGQVESGRRGHPGHRVQRPDGVAAHLQRGGPAADHRLRRRYGTGRSTSRPACDPASTSTTTATTPPAGASTTSSTKPKPKPSVDVDEFDPSAVVRHDVDPAPLPLVGATVTTNRVPPSAVGADADVPAHGRDQLPDDGQAEAGADLAARAGAGTCRAARTPGAGPRGRCPGRRRPRRSRPPSAPETVRVATSTVVAAYLRAFSTRLATTWASRSGSAVGHERPGLPADHQPEARLGGGGLEGRRRRGGPLADVDRAGVEGELPGVEPGQLEEVGHQPLEPAGLGLDDPRRPPAGLLVVGRAALGHRLGVAPDRGQRGAQVVGDAHQEGPFEAAVAAQLGGHGVDRRGRRRPARRRRLGERRPGRRGRRRRWPGRCAPWPPAAG